MKWIDHVIGIIAGVIVVIIGGVGAYYFVPSGSGSDRLEYSVDKTLEFETDKTKVSTFNVNIRNSGEEPSKGVTSLIEVSEGSLISDYRIKTASDPIITYSVKNTDKGGISLSIPSLLPSEIISISLLVSNKIPDLSIAVRSERSIGTKTLDLSNLKAEQLSSIYFWVAVTAIVFFGIILFLFVSFRRFVRKNLSSLSGYKPCKNNTAFLYLHLGHPERAKKLLESEIEATGGDAFVLSNYGLILALEGDHGTAQDYISAARILCGNIDEHALAICDLNESLIYLTQGKKDVGIEMFKKAVAASKDEIIKYCKFSKTIKNIISSNSEIQPLITEEKKTSDDAKI